MKPTGIAKRITRAIDDLQLDDPEDAFYQLCPAIEATATKQFGKGGKKSFRDLISSNMQLMTRVAFRGATLKYVNLRCHINSTLPPGQKPLEANPNGLYTIEQILYHAVRCTLAHQGELPEGFSFKTGQTFGVHTSGLIIPTELLHGIVLMLVTSPENANCTCGENYVISVDGEKLPINKWWGKRHEFEQFLDGLPPRTSP